MKSKMRITGNRTVIGIICIVLALGITFGIAPLVNRFTDRKVEVVQVKQDVERGHLITEDDVRRAAQRGYRIIRYAPDAILTPLAREIAAEKRIELASAVH